MRQIVLDTETTGLSVRDGNRILEIGCVELVDRRLTGNNFHYYINPERDSEEGALEVHGLTTAFLSDKPKFADIAEELRAYVQGAEILIHNAAFDVGYLDMEFERIGMGRFGDHVANIVDTVGMAKELHPGKRVSLDALCDRYGISNAHRTLHGALLDAELLAEVYLAMTRGQNTLGMDLGAEAAAGGAGGEVVLQPLAPAFVLPASADELAEHEGVLDKLDKEAKGTCLWRHVPAEA